MSRAKRLRNGFDKSFRIQDIAPKTDAQADTIDAYREGYNLLLHGAAGTGKTFLALWLALTDVLEGKHSKCIIIRSVVPSREVGFLPGSIEEKIQVYESPYRGICNQLFNAGDAYARLKDKEALEFITTSFERGNTFEDAVIVVDEIQNMNFSELDTTITRVGENCRLIFSGDINQTDLIRKANDKSGISEFITIIKEMEEFDCVEFQIEDVVRSGTVKNYLLTKHRLGIT